MNIFAFKIDNITLNPDPNYAKILDPDPNWVETLDVGPDQIGAKFWIGIQIQCIKIHNTFYV